MIHNPEELKYFQVFLVRGNADNTRWKKGQSDPMPIFLSGNRPLKMITWADKIVKEKLIEKILIRRTHEQAKSLRNLSRKTCSCKQGFRYHSSSCTEQPQVDQAYSRIVLQVVIPNNICVFLFRKTENPL